MPRPIRKSFEGAKYHVTVRGNGRATRFHGAEDYERLAGQLQEAAQRDGVVIYAYALMSNHYHLLVETPRGNIPQFMQRLNTAYAMYYRHKHRKPGHCFQGRYGAKLVEGDDYLLRLTRYIHLNPVKTAAMKDKSLEEKLAVLKRWDWSSYQGYVSKRDRQDWVDYRWRELAGGRSQKEQRRAYEKYILGCMEEKDEVLADVYDRSLYAIGDDEYVQEVEETFRRESDILERPADVARPAIAPLECQQILKTVADVFKIRVATVTHRSPRYGEARRIAVELCCRWCGINQREVALTLGLSEHAVGKQRNQLQEKLQKDPSLQNRFREIERQCIRQR